MCIRDSEYCTNLNFVAGDGTTGKFNPTSPVTVSQAAKMLLTSLGYSATTEGYVGYDWQMNVDVAANTVGLYKELGNPNTSANLTRDQAAQMIYNALNADMVKYEGVWDPSANTIKPQLASTEKTLLETKFGVIAVNAVVMSNDTSTAYAEDVVENEGYTTFAYDKNDDGTINLANETVRLKVATTRDMLGKTVTLYAKASALDKIDRKTTVYGAPILAEDQTIAEYAKNFATGAKLLDALKKDGITSVAGAIVVANWGNAIAQANTSSNTTAADEIAALSGAGIELTFIDANNDKHADFVLVYHPAVGKVTSYTTRDDGAISVARFSGSVSIPLNGEKFEDVVGSDNVKKDDIVSYYELAGKFYISQLESIEGTISKTKGTDTATVDGTDYKLSALVNGPKDTSSALVDATNGVQAGDEVVFYLDGSNNVVFADAVSSEANYVYVLDTKEASGTGAWKNGAEAQLVFADGTLSVVDVTKVYTSNTGSTTMDLTNAATYGTLTGIFTYSVNSDKEYTLRPVKASDVKTDGIKVIKNSAKIATGTSTYASYVANKDTVFVLGNKDGDSFSVYTGIANVPTTELYGAGAYAAVVKSNVAKIVFMTVAEGATTTEDAVYVLDATPSVEKDAKGNNTYTYSVVYKGKVTTLQGESNDVFGGVAGLYTTPKFSGGKLEDVTGASGYQAAAKAEIANQGALKVGSTVYTYDDDTIVFLCEDEKAVESSISEIVTDTGYEDYVSVVADSDGIAQYVFIER